MQHLNNINIFDQLKILQPDQPILVTEPIWGEASYREKLVENFTKHLILLDYI